MDVIHKTSLTPPLPSLQPCCSSQEVFPTLVLQHQVDENPLRPGIEAHLADTSPTSTDLQRCLDVDGANWARVQVSTARWPGRGRMQGMHKDAPCLEWRKSSLHSGCLNLPASLGEPGSSAGCNRVWPGGKRTNQLFAFHSQVKDRFTSISH